MGGSGVVSRKLSRQRRGRDSPSVRSTGDRLSLLYTTPHVMLDELLAQPITQEGIFPTPIRSS